MRRFSAADDALALRGPRMESALEPMPGGRGHLRVSGSGIRGSASSKIGFEIVRPRPPASSRAQSPLALRWPRSRAWLFGSAMCAALEGPVASSRAPAAAAGEAPESVPVSVDQRFFLRAAPALYSLLGAEGFFARGEIGAVDEFDGKPFRSIAAELPGLMLREAPVQIIRVIDVVGGIHAAKDVYVKRHGSLLARSATSRRCHILPALRGPRTMARQRETAEGVASSGRAGLRIGGSANSETGLEIMRPRHRASSQVRTPLALRWPRPRTGLFGSALCAALEGRARRDPVALSIFRYVGERWSRPEAGT